MFAVFSVCNVNFDDRNCILCKTREKAVRRLQSEWENYLNTALAELAKPIPEFELGEIDMEESYHEEEYAIVQDNTGAWREWYMTEASYEPEYTLT